MYSFEEGFGKTPAFNDSTDGISKDYDCLLETCKKEFDLTPKSIDSFNDSGYYILRNNQYKLIFDYNFKLRLRMWMYFMLISLLHLMYI